MLHNAVKHCLKSKNNPRIVPLPLRRCPKLIKTGMREF